MEYIKRVCEKGVESLGERERYYFERLGVDRCEASNFKDNEANTTSGERNLTREGANAIRDEAGVIKRDINSTGGSNVGR